jgi:hypothetical protein
VCHQRVVASLVCGLCSDRSRPQVDRQSKCPHPTHPNAGLDCVLAAGGFADSLMLLLACLWRTAKQSRHSFFTCQNLHQ